MKHSSTTQSSAVNRASQAAGVAAMLAFCTMLAPAADAQGFFQSLQAQAPAGAGASTKAVLPQVFGFSVEQTFHSDFANDALSEARGIYANAAGARVEFSARAYASAERAVKAMTQDVDALLRGGGGIAAREYGRDASGNYIEVARCTRNGLAWTHWVVGDRKYVAASTEAGHEVFLNACPAWSRQPRVQWQSQPFPAYEKAAAAKLPIVFYCFLDGGYSDDFERNVLASADFNALRDRAVFIALEPTVDDAKANGAQVKRQLGVTHYPTTAVVTIEPGPALLERARTEGYRSLAEVMKAFANVLASAPSAAVAAPAQPARLPWPASPFPRPVGGAPLDLSKFEWRWKQ